MLLLLVRHGLTAHTGHRLSGWIPGIHLDERGRVEAEDVARRLEPVPLDAVYSSPIDRALETARPTAKAKRLRIRTREDFGEVRYGDWEGRRLDVLVKNKLWPQLMASPGSIRFPGGEALRETQARAVNGVEALRADHDRRAVAVFTHADVIRLLVAHYTGVHIDLYQRLSIGTGSISAVWLGRLGPRVLKMNDTGSLSGLVPPKRRKR